jgi:hypothetical protein
VSVRSVTYRSISRAIGFYLIVLIVLAVVPLLIIAALGLEATQHAVHVGGGATADMMQILA